MANLEEVKKAIEEAVFHSNRNLYEWTKGEKKRKIFTISHTEVHGVVKNWLIRCLRKVMDTADAARVFQHGYVCVSVDDSNGCILNLSLSPNRTGWRTIERNIQLVADAMKEVHYAGIRYNPSDYIMDTYEPITLNLSSIENIKF